MWRRVWRKKRNTRENQAGSPASSSDVLCASCPLIAKIEASLKCSILVPKKKQPCFFVLAPWKKKRKSPELGSISSYVTSSGDLLALSPAFFPISKPYWAFFPGHIVIVDDWDVCAVSVYKLSPVIFCISFTPVFFLFASFGCHSFSSLSPRGIGTFDITFAMKANSQL